MSEHDIDSQLKEVLDLLRPVPERNPDASRRSRSRFNADLDAFFPAGAAFGSSLKAPAARPEQAIPRPVAPAARPVAHPVARPAAAARPQSWYYRPVFAYLAISLLILVAMFGGGAVTVFAAGSALPGDTLYPVKLSAEQAQVSLSVSPAHQAELYLQFAQNRLNEMNALAALGQYQAVGPLAMQYSHNVALAAERAHRVLQRDPERASILNRQVVQSVEQLKQVAGVVILNAPPALQAALQTALDQALLATPTVEPPAADGNQGSGGNANNNGNPAGGNPSANPNAAGGNATNNNGNSNSNANPNSANDKVKEEKDKDKEEKDKEEKDKDKDKDK
jgi:hypothetical protein